METVLDHNCTTSLGQGCDGASNMSSNQVGEAVKSTRLPH